MPTRNYAHLSPCIDIRYSPSHAKIVVSVRRWTSDGKHTTSAGMFLCDRVDWVLPLPVGPDLLGNVAKRGLDASRQLGKAVPALPAPFEEMFGVRKDNFVSFYPIAVWTKRDNATPFVIGAPVSDRVDIERIEVPKDASDTEFGEAILNVLRHIEKLHWNDVRRLE